VEEHNILLGVFDAIDESGFERPYLIHLREHGVSVGGPIRKGVESAESVICAGMATSRRAMPFTATAYG
jgi:hypothetical protein